MLIIINHKQWGYHTDTYKYCQYTKHKEIIYICQDQGRTRFNEFDWVKVQYVPSSSVFQFILRVNFITKDLSPSSVFVVHFKFCSLLRLSSRAILDIRTLPVNKFWSRRCLEWLIMKWDIIFFRNVSVIAPFMISKLLLKNASVIPLGGEQVVNYGGSKDIVYVGTFYNRKIHEVVRGFGLLLRHDHNFEGDLILIGKGLDSEQELIDSEIKALGVYSSRVKSLGWKSQAEVKTILSQSYLGISYVPLVKYFNYQPPTKTYEYLMAGLKVVATNTVANRDILASDNLGTLCRDNPTSLFLALVWNYDIFRYQLDAEARYSTI